MLDISKTEDLEALIHEAQKWTCSITTSQLGEIRNNDDWITDLFSLSAKNKLLAYGLIEKESVKGCYPLTSKGMQFKSFANEDAKSELADRMMKINVENAERVKATYWVTFGLAVAGFLISVLLLILKLKELAG